MKLILTIFALLTFFATSKVYALPGHYACSYQETSDCCVFHPIGWCKMNDKFIYKVLHEHEWDKLTHTGEFSGSAHDRRDGFIHMATADQLNHVLNSYFKGQSVYIVAFNKNDLNKENLKWENGFPHLYNEPIRIGMVKDKELYFVK